MKQLKNIGTLGFFAIVMLTGCNKFGTAEVSIIEKDTTNPFYNRDTKELTVTAIISDDGGCSYYREQGFCYRLDTFNLPNLNDVNSHIEIVPDNNNPLTLTDTFMKTFMLKGKGDTIISVDTVYSVCAYVKNSAGVSYSNVVKRSTKRAKNLGKEK